MEEIIISLNPWPFVYLVLSLHKEVFPEIVDLCILVLLIIEVVVYRLVIAHLLVISFQPLHDDAGDAYLSFTVSGRPFGMLKQYFVCRYDVFIRDWLYLFGRDPSYDRFLRDAKNHGSGTYHSMVTDRYSPTDSSIRTYPNTVSDRYRFRCFYALNSLLSHDRVTGTSEDYSRRNETHVANRYWTRVKEGNSKVDVCHAKEMGVESKVEVNVMLDHDPFVYVRSSSLTRP